MSLVGSLEDLGLGDILQIVSLSRKSGLLLIHSERGEGRIVFCDGLVRAAYVKGEPEDLRSLLVEADFISADEFDRAGELAVARGAPIAEVLPEVTSLTAESLDSLRREQVERAVFRVFSWVAGEFSFEVRDEIEPRDCEILIPIGINAQYLTMEAMRLSDEGGQEEEQEEAPVEDTAATSSADGGPIVFSGEAESDEASDSGSPFAVPEPVEPIETAPEPTEPIETAEPEIETAEPEVESAEPEVAGVEPEFVSEEPESSGETPAAEDVLAFAAARSEAPEMEVEDLAAAPVEASPSEEDAPQQGIAAASLIAIDPNLSTLEWQKLNLADVFPRVHIFQNGETGISRIRQYLRRGEIPIVLVSIDLATERVTGVESLAEFIRRLKLLAPSMPVLISRYDDARTEESIDAANAILTGPDPALLANRKAWRDLKEEAESFRTEVSAWLKQPGQQASGSKRAERSSASDNAEGSENLRTLRAVSERIRDPANQGDVLKLVLKFAAESFSRVAMFMVRDEIALGIAQIGLPRGGGPEDAELRELELRVSEVEWFRQVLESRSSLCLPATGDGDRALALRIGNREPAQAYIAPIVSGGRVVALLYADNLPGTEPIGDTSVIEIALHEAGLALERVLLQRALAQIGDPSAA
jgi:PAS domain-containing protein